MATSTLTVAASRAVHDSPAVSSMTKRKLQLVVGVILLVVWIVSVAFVGFLARHGSSLRSSVSAASLLTAAIPLVELRNRLAPKRQRAATMTAARAP
jgi:hypothetical protein